MKRKPMTAEHKAKIAVGRKKRKSDNHFNLELGDTGYAIKRYDKLNYVVSINGKTISGVWFGSIPAAVKYILRTTEKQDIKILMREWNRVVKVVEEALARRNNVK